MPSIYSLSNVIHEPTPTAFPRKSCATGSPRSTGLKPDQFEKLLLLNDPVVSLKQAIQVLGRCEKFVRERVYAQEIKAIRSGPRGHIFFRMSELNRWIASQETPVPMLSKPRTVAQQPLPTPEKGH